jgi:TRAP-type C4-dicarboxylate transport system, periplasmic component
MSEIIVITTNGLYNVTFFYKNTAIIEDANIDGFTIGTLWVPDYRTKALPYIFNFLDNYEKLFFSDI